MIATPEKLIDAIRSLNDSGYSGFKGFPPTLAGAIDNWVEVADTLLMDVVPASTGVLLARESLRGILSGISNEAGNAIPLLYSGLTAYATAIAAGMTAAGFVGTPPITPLTHVPTGLVTKDAKIEATNLALALIAWAKTGTATPVTGGPPINWT